MTREEIRGIVEGISDEQLKKILDINSLDVGKAKASAEELEKKLEDEVNKNRILGDEVLMLKESQCEAEEMKIKLDELQKVIDERDNADREKAFAEDLSNRFERASEGAFFVNDFTRAGVFEEFKQALADEKNVGRSDNEIYDELVLGKNNIFVPDGGIPEVVASTMGFGGTLTDGDVREIMGLPELK
jgi:hypothetical protein